MDMLTLEICHLIFLMFSIIYGYNFYYMNRWKLFSMMSHCTENAKDQPVFFHCVFVVYWHWFYSWTCHYNFTIQVHNRIIGKLRNDHILFSQALFLNQLLWKSLLLFEYVASKPDLMCYIKQSWHYIQLYLLLFLLDFSLNNHCFDTMTPLTF